MKNVFLIASFALALACGGPQDDTPIPPPTPVGGPGIVAAPDGVPIAYTVSGGGEPAIVFIHGWMCDQSFWAAQTEALAGKYTVVTLDLAGHGASGMEREGWPLLAFGADVAAVVEHLGLAQVILVGHSMGGPVILEAARLMPDRVIGLVGVDTLLDADYEWDREQMKSFTAALETDFVATCGAFVSSMFVEESDPALIERVQTDMCSGPPELGITLMRSFVDYDQAAAMAAVPAAIPLRCINAPTFPANIEGNRAYHQDFDATTIDGVGHFLMMEKPDEFNASLIKLITEFVQGGNSEVTTG
ncbi:MAG: alpha/beta fold hydrolase [Thermoanaerobaculales bacterium]